MLLIADMLTQKSLPGMPYFWCGMKESTFVLVPQKFMTFQSKGKGKAHPRAGHEGPGEGVDV
jgi:hypothetical protein